MYIYIRIIFVLSGLQRLALRYLQGSLIIPVKTEVEKMLKVKERPKIAKLFKK